MFIDLVTGERKTEGELMHRQPIQLSSHIEAVVQVCQVVDSYSVLAMSTVAAQTTVTNSDSYVLENARAGTYTLRVSSPNYVSRDYAVTLGDKAVTLDAELRLLGDVKGDGKIDAMDKKVLYNHIASPVLTGYDFAVGDVNGDGIIDAKDKKILFNHIAGTTSLWK